MKKFTLFLFLMLILTSCDISEFTEMIENAGNITGVMERNFDCHEVSLLEYNVHNYTTTAAYKMVGCEPSNQNEVKNQVMSLLQDSIPNFCEIDNFSLVFVYKGERTVYTYKKCELID